MHTVRVIPCLDVNNNRVVKGVNFVNLRDAGDPVEIAKAYDKAGADEVVFLDITASSDGRHTVVDMVLTRWRLIRLPLRDLNLLAKLRRSSEVSVWCLL